MNIFKHHGEITGYFNPDSTCGSLKSLFTQANQIRSNLGRKGYLLDCYLSLFFEAANAMLSYDIGSDGFSKGGELRKFCFNIIDEKETSHPFRSKAKQFLTEGISDYQERSTRMGLLYLSLADDFLSLSVKLLVPKINHQMACDIDFPHLHELYGQIAEVIGENQMEQLNLRLKQHFITAPLTTFYIQGMNNDLLYTLTSRDNETSREAFQLYMKALRKHS